MLPKSVVLDRSVPHGKPGKAVSLYRHPRFAELTEGLIEPEEKEEEEEEEE